MPGSVHRPRTVLQSTYREQRGPTDSGRVNIKNSSPTVANKTDPVSGFQGIPRNMTGIAQKLRDVGYRTGDQHSIDFSRANLTCILPAAMTGKWDAGTSA